MNEKIVCSWIDENKDYLTGISDKIWDYAEIGLKETKSALLLEEELAKNGFQIEKGIGGMSTAFKATWGRGNPVIGLLAEYDALISSSQKRASAVKEEIEEGRPGHACGHNLLGTAHLATALAVKKVLQEKDLSGTIVFFGCPAEEFLFGKVFMAREGVFDGLDAAFSWHPDTMNGVMEEIWQAIINAKFNFYGIPSHAAASPEQGRSALDGVELMNIGVNYLREHIVDSARIHYTISNGGGQPNTVPEYAQVWYYVRGPERETTEEIFQRVIKIAEGASLMTQTKMEVQYLAASPENLPNDVLEEVLYNSMNKLTGIEWDEEDIKYAKKIIKTVDQRKYESQIANIKENFGLDKEEDKYLCRKVLPLKKAHPHLAVGSSDVSDVTWVAPTAQIITACSPLGTALHSWQFTAAAGSGIGHKGMLFAAKTLSLACLELIENPNLVRMAKDEFRKRTDKKPFVSMVPKEAKVPLGQFI